MRFYSLTKLHEEDEFRNFMNTIERPLLADSSHPRRAAMGG